MRLCHQPHCLDTAKDNTAPPPYGAVGLRVGQNSYRNYNPRTATGVACRANTTRTWMSRQNMKTALWILFSASLMVLLAAVFYCWRNEAGHSAVSPLGSIYFFAPVFVVGLSARIFVGRTWLSARMVEITGFVGMAFAFFVTRLGILNQYQDWIDTGMPARNPDTTLLLTGFVLGALGGSLAIGYLITPQAEQVDAG